MQSESYKNQIVEIYRKDLKDITKNCVKIYTAFICLRVEKPNQISKLVFDKTLIIIGLGRLYTANDIFNEIDLPPNENVIIFDDKPQYFDRGKKGDGLGIVMRIKFKSLY